MIKFPSLSRFFGSAQPVPAQYQSNFFHLYQDMTWFGMLTGSSLAYLTIYAARLGASGQQVGLISAAPAIINLLFALPAGHWLEKQVLNKAVFTTSLLNRIFYLFLVPLPWLLGDQGQVWVLIVFTLLMSIPGTYLSMGFNALFADAVPAEWRGHVAGVRNAGYSLMTVATSVVCGFVLAHFSFPVGYQIVFLIGYVGAMMSSYHLFHVHQIPEPMLIPQVKNPVKWLNLGVLNFTMNGLRSGISLRPFSRFFRRDMLRLEILRSPFGQVLAVLFFFHLSQYLAIPVFPIYQVNVLHLTDQVISLGNALFYGTMFFGSIQLARLSGRLGHKKVTGWGVVLLAIYPALLSISYTVALFLITSLLGGLAWSLVGGALYNYLLERVPAEDRPAHLAWYNLILNTAILLGSLGGPLLGSLTGLAVALVTFAALRFLAGVVILKWG
jgi:MFS family permease